jgi:Zinc-binding dehydrogenase
MLRRGGTCALVGMPPGEFPTPIFDVVLKRLTIRGSIVGTRKDLEEALQFAGEGKVTASVEGQPLEAINTVFDRLRRGDVQGRVVLQIAVGTSALSGAAAGLYLLAVRPWHLRWGATGAEVSTELPGDALVPHAKLVSTRAITIHARAHEIWPWLLQIGEGRGGIYSYTWLENLVGCQMQNADRIVPELQHLEVGDTIWLARSWNERFGVPSYLVVAEIDPGRALVLRNSDVPGSGDAFSWAFVLRKQDEESTRLIVRSRSVWGAGVGSVLLGRVMGEPAHFVMERAMMLGIKHRAEVTPKEGTPATERVQ